MCQDVKDPEAHKRVNLPHVKERLPALINHLDWLSANSSIGKQYAGEAVGMLRLLQDILE